ncbi:hypothetical protein BH23ACT9_BH23ACT9_22190 [soil metagenome]
MPLSSRTRVLILALTAALVMALAPIATQAPAFAGPVAANDSTYGVCGRVFPDPQAFGPLPAQGPGRSPFAKGNAVCQATTFISHTDALAGLAYLDQRADTGPFIEIIDLSTSTDPRIRAALDEELGDGFTAGLPTATGTREQVPLHLIKVTAPPGAQLVPGVAQVPEAQREHFVFPLSIHGIERAGIEGGLRSIEDLVTWGAREPQRPVLETYGSNTIETGSGTARNLPVGEVLMRSVSYFVLANPDGWRRGSDVGADRLPAGVPVSFSRYNGNGMDMNRDWPAIGYTEQQYTPWSEPETRSFGKVLQSLSDNWSGGIDLHGQLIDRAFSFTLIGGSQRPFDKNQRVQQFVEEAYADAEIRLAWSGLIKPNNAPAEDPRLFGVQYGTIWDTIDYTVTGAIGDWIDSPLGLDADGIDNEMSLSHLSNCGTGTCYIPEAEQLHIDGNKSLIYGMLNFNLQPPPAQFDLGGTDVAVLANPRRLVNAGFGFPEAPAGATAPTSLSGTANHTGAGTTTLGTFQVANSANTFTGGIAADITYVGGAAGASPGALNALHIERMNATGGWTRLQSYFNQSPIYVQAGQRVDHNHPINGTYRVTVTGNVPSPIAYRINFTTQPVWPEIGQTPYNVRNTELFTDLRRFVTNGTITLVDPRRVLDGTRDLAAFDTVIAIDDAFLPGYLDEVGRTGEVRTPQPAGGLRNDNRAPDEAGKNALTSLGFTAADLQTMTTAADAFVRSGGNLVLTDDSLRALEWLGYTAPGSVHTKRVYAGHVSFRVGGVDTFDRALAAGVDKPGAATGSNNRRQITEPVPIGYRVPPSAGSTGGTSPQWYVDRAPFEAAGSAQTVGGDGTDANAGNRVSLGELTVGAGKVRILGSLAPFPTTQYNHMYGLSNYAITDAGYIVLGNLLRHTNPAQIRPPVTGGGGGDGGLVDDDIDPIDSPVDTRPDDDPRIPGQEVPVEPLVPIQIERYAGEGRVSTAVDISQNRFGPGEGRNVVVATAGNFPDALAGGPAAFLSDAPILLTDTDELPAATRAEIERLRPERVFVLGGTAAVSDAVLAELHDLALVGAERVGADDRFGTAAAVAERFFTGSEGTVYVATGGDFPDTLAAGPGAGLASAPVLLVQADAVPPATRTQLERLAPDRIVIVGGTATIGAAVEEELAELAGSVDRLAGAERIATALAVSADVFPDEASAVYLATGGNFPDGLAGGPAAAGEPGPILLVGDRLTDEVIDEIRRLGVRRVVILGGTAAVSQAVEDELRAALQ